MKGNSRYWALVGWNTIVKPKEYGGLGVRETRLVNISLLGKLIYQLINSPGNFGSKCLNTNTCDNFLFVLLPKQARGPMYGEIFYELESLKTGGLG